MKEIQNNPYQEILSSQDYLVVQSNDLAKAFGNLSSFEHKLLDYCFSLLDIRDTKNEAIKVETKDIIAYFNLPCTRQSQEEIYRAFKKLIKKTEINIPINIGNPKGISKLPLFCMIDFYNNGIISYQFTEKVTPFIFDFRKNYFSFSLDELSQVKSKYTYTLLKLWESNRFNKNKETVILGTVEDWQDWLLGSGKRMLTPIFKRNCLKVGAEEIENKFNAKIILKTIKTGRKIEGYEMVIVDNRTPDSEIEGTWSINELANYSERDSMPNSRSIIYQAFKGKNLKPLEAILGVDTDGNPVIYNLATAPHMLVLGTTGSGKSVGVNQVILTIMKHNTPEQVQFMMIDPRHVEFAVYKDSPFMRANPVTSINDMPKLLGYSILEQHDRYAEFKRYGVRNIEAYNKKMDELGKKKMPYLVLVVDELANMMMSASKEVEDYIICLGQKARACGIHMILATQILRADVVTNALKVNIPTRVVYKVSSPLDSYIAFDEEGGETLEGNGDSFIKWNGRPKVRVRSMYIDNDETKAILESIKNKFEPTEKVDYKTVYDNRKNELKIEL